MGEMWNSRLSITSSISEITLSNISFVENETTVHIYPRSSTPLPIPLKIVVPEKWPLQNRAYQIFSNVLNKPRRSFPIRGLKKDLLPNDIVSGLIVMNLDEGLINDDDETIRDFTQKLKSLKEKLIGLFRKLIKGGWSCEEDCNDFKCKCRQERSLLNKRITPEDEEDFPFNFFV